MAQNSNAVADDPSVLAFSRTFDAPAALVFKMWSDPEHMVRWHGPEGMWLSECQMDFRVGGHWRRTMVHAGGGGHGISGTYTAIEPNSRLAFTYINDYDGHEMLVEMDFVERDGKTEMQFRQAPFLNRAERDGHGWGWSSGFKLFADYVAAVKVADGRLVGAPRADGVAADIVAARQRLVEKQQQQQQQ